MLVFLFNPIDEVSVLKRPNLLYIHSDQHSPFVSGCYGDALVKTPHLDSLAKKGVLFHNAYCPSPICVPSRMSTLTGQHPYQNKVWCNEHILSSGIPTMAHALGAASYNPVLIGRMHAVGPDQLHGYTKRLVGDHGPNYVGGDAVDHGILKGTSGPHRVSLERSGLGRNAYQLHDEYVTVATLDFLQKTAMERRVGLSDEPFCLSVGFMLPHQPYVAEQEDYLLYRELMKPPNMPHSALNEHPALLNWRKKTNILTVSQEEIMRARTAYWGMVTRLDHMIGQILTTLEELGLDDNTLIIYTSDHGEQVGEHGLWWKQTFYEASVKIPMILSWKGKITEGEERDHVVNSLDLNATILDALGAPALPRSQGRSLLPLITHHDKEIKWENKTFSEYCTNDGYISRMIRQDEWKLNYYHGYQPQLFNLSEDPHETNDLSSDPQYKNVIEGLLQSLLSDWDPEQILEEINVLSKESSIITSWAEKTKPTDQYRWQLKPDMNQLNQ
jgi:choline-sulfatase